ncbi:MAG: TolC family protein [Verrucomicrobiota bacterium]|nr:TolC family protein [Verrucomicrobiota bacterium]
MLLAQERAASAAVDLAIADLFPSLGVNAQYGGSGSDFPLVWNWSAGFRSVLSLFASWRDTEKVNEAVARLRAARAKIADREQQIRLDLSRGWNQLENVRRRLRLTELIARSTRESLDLINERYNLKAASAVEVTDAQVALTRARGDRVKARFDCEAAVARIRHAVGGEEQQ